jgi:hypothetical protein
MKHRSVYSYLSETRFVVTRLFVPKVRKTPYLHFLRMKTKFLMFKTSPLQTLDFLLLSNVSLIPLLDLINRKRILPSEVRNSFSTGLLGIV